MQIELSDEAEFLQFFKEYSLTDGPLRADTLIIKKDPERHIHKNIGQIFRRFNVVEYKNPWESLTVRTYYQAVSYAAVFQSHTDRENAVLPEEITLTLVGNHYPRKLFRFLEDFYNARIEQSFSGIYYVEGAVFPTQVIVQKESEKMCNALNELFADKMERARESGLAEGEKKGRAEGRTEGRAEGRSLSVLALLEDLGQIPSSLRERIMSQRDSNVLTGWLKAAAAAASVEDFKKAAKL